MTLNIGITYLDNNFTIRVRLQKSIIVMGRMPFVFSTFQTRK